MSEEVQFDERDEAAASAAQDDAVIKLAEAELEELRQINDLKSKEFHKRFTYLCERFGVRACCIALGYSKDPVMSGDTKMIQSVSDAIEFFKLRDLILRDYGKMEKVANILNIKVKPGNNLAETFINIVLKRRFYRVLLWPFFFFKKAIERSPNVA